MMNHFIFAPQSPQNRLDDRYDGYFDVPINTLKKVGNNYIKRISEDTACLLRNEDFSNDNAHRITYVTREFKMDTQVLGWCRVLYTYKEQSRNDKEETGQFKKEIAAFIASNTSRLSK